MVRFYICTLCFFLLYSGGGGAVIVLMRFSKLQQQDGAVRRGCKVASMVVLARLYVAILAWFSEHRLHLAVVQQDIRLGLAPQRNWHFFIFWILALGSLERSNIPLCHVDILTTRQVYLSLLSSLCFVLFFIPDRDAKSDSDSATSEGRRRLDEMRSIQLAEA